MFNLKNFSRRGLSDTFDLFSRPVYSFTFKRSRVMSTSPGVCCSVFLAFILILFGLAKLQDYSSNVYNVVNANQFDDLGYFDDSASLDGVRMAFGLQYKEEFQDEMVDLKEDDLKKVVSMKMKMVSKDAGSISTADLRVVACSTTDYNVNFYTPRKSVKSDWEYLKEFRPLWCV